MLDNFSRTVAEIYELAEHASVDDFPGEIVRCINVLIRHDGGIFGVGGFDEAPESASKFLIENAYCFDRDSQSIFNYEMLSNLDPIKDSFCRGLTRPIVCRCNELYAQLNFLQLQNFAKKHSISSLLLFGSPRGHRVHVVWVVFYRNTDPSFTRLCARYLHALWPHIERSFEVNRIKMLRRDDLAGTRRASAILTSQFRVEFVDSKFFSLMRLEWPEWQGYVLPQCALAVLSSGHAFRGVKIQLQVVRHGVHNICEVFEISVMKGLTKTESVVASAYASGLSNKEIARELNVSVSTVRTHVAHVFEKFQVHRRAELARKLDTP